MEAAWDILGTGDAVGLAHIRQIDLDVALWLGFLGESLHVHEPGVVSVLDLVGGDLEHVGVVVVLLLHGVHVGVIELLVLTLLLEVPWWCLHVNLAVEFLDECLDLRGGRGCISWSW